MLKFVQMLPAEPTYDEGGYKHEGFYVLREDGAIFHAYAHDDRKSSFMTMKYKETWKAPKNGKS